jgi:hypothetical protein
VVWFVILFDILLIGILMVYTQKIPGWHFTKILCSKAQTESVWISHRNLCDYSKKKKKTKTKKMIELGGIWSWTQFSLVAAEVRLSLDHWSMSVTNEKCRI